jgi:hypothetical protein
VRKLTLGLICVGVVIIILPVVRVENIQDACEDHGGVLIRLHGRPGICIKKEVVITYEDI